MITLQILAFYHYWGNINLMTNSIGFLAGCVAVCFMSSYTVIFWKNFCEVTDTFERNSIFYSELVRSNKKHMKILNENLNLAQIYNKVISMSVILMTIIFILPTFVQHLMTSDEVILQEAETVDGFTKFFIFVIWLPPLVKQEYIIRVMYGLQCICVWEMNLFIANIAPFYTVLLLCTGTQFKLISTIIREMDEVMCRVENPVNILHVVPIQMSEDHPLKSNMNIEEPTALSTGRIQSSKKQQNSLQECDINRKSEGNHDLSPPEIKSTIKNDAESFYLLECIKLHQASIK
jgi:hypothetical protein